MVRAVDLARQCNTAADGSKVAAYLSDRLGRGESVELSFEGVYDVPSSFVNTAIVAVFKQFGEGFVRSHLRITHANKQIADMIRRCIANGLRR